MAHSRTYQAIVLQTHDVGEADRFCIFFTKERGRIAARAKGVRKPKSRMGGCILPLSHVSVNLTETKSGFLVTSAQLQSDPLQSCSANAIFEAQHAMEVLLSLLHDEEALPEVFDLTVQLLEKTQQSATGYTLPFSLRLLHLFGLLPSSEDAPLQTEEQSQLRECIQGDWNSLPHMREGAFSQLAIFCQKLLDDQITRPLRSNAVLATVHT